MTKLENRLVNLLLLCLGTFSQIAIIAESFGCSMRRSVWLWLLAACILLWISGSFRRGFWVGLPLSAGLLYLAYLFYGQNPLLQLQDLIDRISGAFYTHITNPGAAYPYANTASSHSLALLFLGFLLAAYLSTALTSRNMRVPLTLLETLPIFIACVVVNGHMPAMPTMGLLLFWFLILAGGGFHPEGSLWRTVLCCALPIALLLGGMLLMYGPKKYVYTERDRELAERFDRLSHSFDLFIGRSKEGAIYSSDPDQDSATSAPRSQFQPTWDANDKSMLLENTFDAEHADLRLLQVKAETSGRLYLRTQSYGDYTGTGWLPAEELSSGSSLPFTAFAAAASASGVKRELEIRTFLDLNALCIPYYAAVSSGSDASVSAADQISYRVSYTEYTGNPEALRIPDEARAAENLYRSHAHQVYTRLPDDTKEAALRICEQAGLQGNDPDLIGKLANYVRESGEYDLMTPAYPSDDYAIYFLTESHRGYCIHYATAAAVLYRALGVPARVTEGFVAEARAGSFTDIVAGDAHAWVEIYRDGVGWIPVEVTARGGYATAEPESTPSPSPQPSPESTAESASPESGTGSEGGTPSPDPEQPNSVKVRRPFPWRLLLILPALAVLLLLWYLLARASYLSQIRNPDGRKGVLACWRYARRAAAFGGEIPELIQNLAEKVAFSPHMIRRDELEACRTSLQTLIDEIYPNLSLFAKFRFRCLRGMK